MLVRADFIKLSAAAGTGLVLGARLPAEGAAGGAFAPNVWVAIRPDESVVVTINKSEMGQGVATGLPTILADELDAKFDRVRVEFAPADEHYLDPVNKNISTGGSTSTPHMWMPMRQAGATARAMLVTAAAQKWGVDPATCTAREGVVYHTGSDRSQTYGDLVFAAALLPVPANVPLKSQDRFTLIGKQRARTDIPNKVNGKTKYGLDVRLPGMLYGAVARSPVFGGTLAHYDDSTAKAIKGVKAIFPISSGVAVVAGDSWTAQRAKFALKIQWDEGANAHLNSDALFREAAELARSGKQTVAKHAGDVSKVQGNALEATYRGPFLSHATMERITQRPS